MTAGDKRKLGYKCSMENTECGVQKVKNEKYEK